MGRVDPSSRRGRRRIVDDRLLLKFAQLMREHYGADLYLFGSRARGDAQVGSDYDLVAVAAAFADQSPLRRAPDRYALWREAGGAGISLDLQCYTPAEFRRQLGGLGYLSEAQEKGELILVLRMAKDEAGPLTRGKAMLVQESGHD